MAQPSPWDEPMNMLEKVARAIWEAARNVGTAKTAEEVAANYARAAIEAMREPLDQVFKGQTYKSTDCARQTIQAMIDEALK